MLLKKLNKRKENGFIALVTIIIVASVSLIMALNASLLGLGELDMGYTSQRGSEAFAIADGCMEETFRRLSLDSGYIGGNISMNEGFCSVTILVDGDIRDISVIANTTGNYFKEIDATITLTTDTVPKVVINSWGEITAHTPPPPPLTPSTITVTPPNLSFTDTNQTSQLTATVYDQNSDVMTGQSITYTSSNTSVSIVSGSGLVTSSGEGSATITGTSGALLDTTSVSVTIPAVPAPTSISLLPTTLSFDDKNQTSQLTVTIYDQYNNPMTGQSVTYTSSNTSVATVNSSGLVTSKGSGNATITATSGSLSDTTSVSVTVPVVLTPTSLLLLPSNLSFVSTYQTAQLTATVHDQNGNVVSGQPITYTSSNTSVATVNSSGLVTTTGFGGATITATSGSLSDTTSVSVIFDWWEGGFGGGL